MIANHTMVKTKEAVKYKEIEICTPRLTHLFKAADLADVNFQTVNGMPNAVITTMDGLVHEFYGNISIHTVIEYKGE